VRVGGLLPAVVVASILAASILAAQSCASGIPGSTDCKPFVAAKWQNPYPPHEIGKHYQIILVGKVFSCSSAFAYVKKFILEKIKPEKTMPAIGLVTGGPSGYNCTSGISYTHAAYQGNCIQKNPTPSSSSFSWGPYNDS
jgi:hypothetical protein